MRVFEKKRKLRELREYEEEEILCKESIPTLWIYFTILSRD